MHKHLFLKAIEVLAEVNKLNKISRSCLKIQKYWRRRKAARKIQTFLRKYIYTPPTCGSEKGSVSYHIRYHTVFVETVKKENIFLSDLIFLSLYRPCCCSLCNAWKSKHWKRRQQ